MFARVLRSFRADSKRLPALRRAYTSASSKAISPLLGSIAVATAFGTLVTFSALDSSKKDDMTAEDDYVKKYPLIRSTIERRFQERAEFEATVQELAGKFTDAAPELGQDVGDDSTSSEFTEEAVASSAPTRGALNRRGRVNVVLGAQWGDEGKGKLVDILSGNYAICARVAGGSNAGHTIVVNGTKHKFHLVPSGILNESVHCVIGNGVVVHLRGLLKELEALRAAGVQYDGRLHLSDRAHIVFDFHQAVDGYQENHLAGKKIGTTLKGIGPAYSSKTQRNGVRVGDLQDMAYFEARLRSLAEQLMRSHPGLEIDVEAEIAYYNSIRDELLPLITDTVAYCNEALATGKDVLVEGANATMLDLDFGTFPYVTSSNPSVGSACTGLGVPPRDIHGVAGVVKAYCTRVGEGPFPTELEDAVGEQLRAKGGEYGTTTGRPRRCGWIDIPQLKHSIMVNGIDSINLTKLDVLTGFKEVKIGVRYVDEAGEEVKSMPASINRLARVRVEYETLPGWSEDISQCRRFEDLPANCQAYLRRLEELLGGVQIAWVGVGNGRSDMISMGNTTSYAGDLGDQQ